jgi:Protein of unknown function (DUF3800)
MRRLHAFIDEAGQRSRSKRSSSHFVMAAVVAADERLGDIRQALAALRSDLGRRPQDCLHWQNLRAHSQRVHAAQSLGRMPVTVSAVVVCKRHLATGVPDEHHAYLFTLRMLLERLSWFAEGQGAVLSYTLAHIVRFKLAQLREYEAKLRARQTTLKWAHLDPSGGSIDQPKRVEQLQLADIAASAIFQAFEPDQFGNTERRYLLELAARLYRREGSALTSYGLKVHPWSETARAAYPWVAALR